MRRQQQRRVCWCEAAFMFIVGVVALQLYVVHFEREVNSSQDLQRELEKFHAARTRPRAPKRKLPTRQPTTTPQLMRAPSDPRLAYRIAVVIPYVGPRLPDWFPLFAASCAGSSDLIDFLIFLQEPVAQPKGFDPPANLKYVPIGAQGFAYLHARTANDSSLAPLLIDAFRRQPRQLVEFKPAIGWIFREYLRNYTHWVFGDLDVVMGSSALIQLDELEQFDVVTYSFGDQNRAYTRGQWTMHANTDRVNLAFRHCSYLTHKLASRLSRGAHYESCEGCYSLAVRAAELRVKFVVKAFTDAEKDSEEVWLVHGQVRRCVQTDCRPLAPTATIKSLGDANNSGRKPVRARLVQKRCMGWVNPAYQPCLDGAQSDETVELMDGEYTRIMAPVVEYREGFSQGAFFHFQEWKKKFRSFAAHLPQPYDGYAVEGDFVRLRRRTDETLTLFTRAAVIRKRPIDSNLNVLAARQGFVPIPAIRPKEQHKNARLSKDIDDAVPLKYASTIHHCAFKACGKAIPAFGRLDLAQIYPSTALGRAGDPERRLRFQQTGIALAVSGTLRDLDTIAANACEWSGPVLVALALFVDEDVHPSRFACRENASSLTLVLGLDGLQPDVSPPLKALLNVALDAAPTRFALTLRGPERLGPGCYAALMNALATEDEGSSSSSSSSTRSPRATTLVLPEFVLPDDQTRPSLEFAASVATGCDAHPALSDAAYRAWLSTSDNLASVVGGNLLRKPLNGSSLAKLDPAPVLVVDALDKRGDRRIVRELDELSARGCYDSAFARSLSVVNDPDALSLAPNAFVYRRTSDAHDERACACADAKLVRATIHAYSAFLETAVSLRIVVDDEAHTRSWGSLKRDQPRNSPGSVADA